MIEPEKRKAIFLLHREGMGAREISRRLGVSRNAVRKIIDERGEAPVSRQGDKIQIDRALLEKLHEECDGWKQRMHEKLREEENVNLGYSTLTRMLRELEIGYEPKARCDHVPDEPGAEMQHDTSPYVVKLSEEPVKLVGSLIYMRYSKARYLRFYRHFNRFKMKCFLHEALTHWGHAAKICVIDNTNLARLRGTGKNAVLVPEMDSFSKLYGFQFLCHEKGHCNRKAGEERSFWTVETNFFPGRTFESLEDLNAQAFEWATVRMYHRPTRSGLIPAKAFEHETAHLKRVPPYLAAPYQVHARRTDEYGYVSFAANYYWVPGDGRPEIRVLEYSDLLKLYADRKLLAEYPVPPDGVRNRRFSPEGMPPPRRQPRNRKKPTVEEAKRLRAMADPVGQYLDLVLEPKGLQRHNFLRALFRLSQEMTPRLFVETIQRALKYRIDDIETIRRIAIMYLNEGGGYVRLTAEVDESFVDRPAYEEGRFTDEPDLSQYDDFKEESDG